MIRRIAIGVVALVFLGQAGFFLVCLASGYCPHRRIPGPCRRALRSRCDAWRSTIYA